MSLSEEQLQLKEAVLKFARQELSADVGRMDREGEFNIQGWRKCGELGIQGLPVQKKYGGSEADPLTTIVALEALGYGCRDNGLLFSLNAHIWSCEIPILTSGTEAHKQHYLTKLCRGEWIGGNAMSEPDSGSDAFSLKTTARKVGDRYILNGGKVFATNAPVADVMIVYATVDRSKGQYGVTAFLVERGFPGYSVSRKTEKMGLRTSPMGEIFLDDCEVPAENCLGREGAGAAIFTHSMEWERSFILASAVGTMGRLLETCVQYAKQRKQFGKPIGKFQLVASKIVDMKMRLETARLLLYRLAWLKQRGQPALMEAALAKLYVSECWTQSCLDAIQLHGGYGYMSEFELERELRDALGSKLYSGTSEIQRQIVAQFLGL